MVPPNSFALARSVEYFRIPRNVLTICVGKSTYARCGIITNVTPFEPEWEGHITLEISNTKLHEVMAQAFEQAGRQDSARARWRAVESAWRSADPQFRERYRVAKQKAGL